MPNLRTYKTNIDTKKKFEVQFTSSSLILSNFPNQNKIGTISLLNGDSPLGNSPRVTREEHTFTNVFANNPNVVGNNASFDVTINSFTGAINTVSLNQGGASYNVNDNITVLGTQLGEDSPNDSPYRNLVLNVDSVDSPAKRIVTFSIVSGDSPELDRIQNLLDSPIVRSVELLSDSPSNIGFNARADVTLSRRTGAITSISLSNPGTSYVVNQTLKIRHRDLATQKVILRDSPNHIENVLNSTPAFPNFNSPFGGEDCPSAGQINVEVLRSTFANNTPIPDSPFTLVKVLTIDNVDYNGKYTLNGFVNDKPSYKLNSPVTLNSPVQDVRISFQNNQWEITNSPTFNEPICINNLNNTDHIPPNENWNLQIQTEKNVHVNDRDLNAFVADFESPALGEEVIPQITDESASPNLIRIVHRDNSPFFKNEILDSKLLVSCNVVTPNTSLNGFAVINELEGLYVKGDVLTGTLSKVSKTVLQARAFAASQTPVEEPVVVAIGDTPVPLGFEELGNTPPTIDNNTPAYNSYIELLFDYSPSDPYWEYEDADCPTGTIFQQGFTESSESPGVYVQSNSPLAGIVPFGQGFDSPGISLFNSPSDSPAFDSPGFNLFNSPSDSPLFGSSDSTDTGDTDAGAGDVNYGQPDSGGGY